LRAEHREEAAERLRWIPDGIRDATDARVFGGPVEAGTHAESVKLRSADLVKISGAQVADIAAA